MRSIALLAALFVSASALGQRQYGDPYAGAMQTVAMYAEQNRMSSYRNDFSTPAYRVEQQIWRPSTPSYQASPTSPSSTGLGSEVHRPRPMLVPYGNTGQASERARDGYSISMEILKGRGRAPNAVPAPVAADSTDLWSLYPVEGPGGDPVRAVALARPRADSGDAQAMLLLALAYLQGRGLPADERQSFAWMTRAAESNERNAQTLLGEMYLNGIGVEADESTALVWLQRAADAGEPRAALEVGLILSSERPGVPADQGRAAAYLERAARAGDDMGQYLYAICLQTGMGVARDKAAAIDWLRKASDQGLAMAQLRLGQAYYFAEGAPHDYRRALELFELAAAQSELGAFNYLGMYYSDGLAVVPDLPRAMDFFRKGAEQGDREAQFNLGSAYGIGFGVPRDDREAMRWVTLAADAGNPMAQYMAGLASLAGLGVPPDAAQGVRRLQLSAAGRFAPALDKLCDLSMRERSGLDMTSPEFTSTLQAGTAENQPACLYVQAARLNNGILGPQDPDQAVDLLERAAEGGYHQAELDYGSQFLALIGRMDASNDADLRATARFWLNRAAEHGSQQAEELLRQQGWR